MSDKSGVNHTNSKPDPIGPTKNSSAPPPAARPIVYDSVSLQTKAMKLFPFPHGDLRDAYTRGATDFFENQWIVLRKIKNIINDPKSSYTDARVITKIIDDYLQGNIDAIAEESDTPPK